MTGVVTPVASLPMYDPEPLQATNDRFWVLIRDGLRERGATAPDMLTRVADYSAAWRDPGLVLSQICGLPYRAGLHEHVALIGTPDYGVEGCAPGFYRSVLIAHADDPRDRLAAFDGARAAHNDALSQSGWGALWATMAEAGIALRTGPATGTHRATAIALAEGRAEIAAIDAVTWRILARWEPDRVARLKVIGHTAPAPGLPLVAAAGAPADLIRAAVGRAITALGAADRAALGLVGLVPLPKEAYLALPLPPDPAQFGGSR